MLFTDEVACRKCPEYDGIPGAGRRLLLEFKAFDLVVEANLSTANRKLPCESSGKAYISKLFSGLSRIEGPPKASEKNKHLILICTIT